MLQHGWSDVKELNSLLQVENQRQGTGVRYYYHGVVSLGQQPESVPQS